MVRIYTLLVVCVMGAVLCASAEPEEEVPVVMPEDLPKDPFTVENVEKLRVALQESQVSTLLA